MDETQIPLNLRAVDSGSSQGWTTTGGHTSSPCRTPEKAEGTWGDNGRDGQTS